MEEKPVFESALSELETIVKTLEEGNLPLDQMVSLYEKGAQLGKDCLELLDSYEGRVTKLSDAAEAEGE